MSIKGDIMNLTDQLKLYVGAYFGVQSMDEYGLKVYVLKEIKDYIDNFIKENNIENSEEIIENVKNNVSLKVKLQDSLILLNQINGSMELILLIKKKLKEIS